MRLPILGCVAHIYRRYAFLSTGGGSGIGRAVCVEFSKQGAKVAVVDINGDTATQTLESLEGKHGKESQNMILQWNLSCPCPHSLGQRGYVRDHHVNITNPLTFSLI